MYVNMVRQLSTYVYTGQRRGRRDSRSANNLFIYLGIWYMKFFASRNLSSIVPSLEHIQNPKLKKNTHDSKHAEHAFCYMLAYVTNARINMVPTVLPETF